MATTEPATQRAERGGAGIAPKASLRLDWGMAGLSIWLIVGFYLDLWAHAHDMVDDTFLTPWHAVLYAGAAAFGLTLGVLAARNLLRGSPWREALPGPYLASLAGVVAFVVAGQLDFVWHEAFGFEASVDALLSPPHLALAASGVIALSGPIRSVWSRPAGATTASWGAQGPAVIGLAALLSVFAAFTQYAHPIMDPRAEATAGDERPPVAQLYAMAADGTGQHRIAVTDVDERNPRLSPDGRLLAFDRTQDGATHIVVSRPDGSDPRQLSTDGRTGRAAWSPDGTRIAFHSDRSGSLDIYTMAADGTDVRRITSEPSSEWVAAWSPDGARLAFVSDRDGSADIYTATADGTDVVRLTRDGRGESDPDWSPDGTRIAFGTDGPDGEPDVVTIAADGTDLRRLTDAPGSSYLPAWSPDGRSIAFVTDRDGDLEVYVMDADGTNQRNLTRSPALRDGWYGPSWSPDGTSILYPSEAETPPEPVVDLRQALGAASILIQAILLTGVALVALRHGPLPFGALTLLTVGPTVLMTLVSDEYRFLPGTLVAGVVVDLLVRRLRDGTSRRSAAAIAFAIPATFYGAYFVTLQLTGGIGWTIHLWLGAMVLAGVVGILLDLAGRGARPAPTA